MVIIVIYQCVVKKKEKQLINLFGNIKIKNMEETIVSFKVAKLAKKKGFDISQSQMYASNGNITDKVYDFDNWCEAPTQSLLQKWLREIHKKHINVQPFYYKSNFISWDLKIHNTYYKDKFNTYEEALEKGLLEGLKLIKDGKNS
jgi:hypothetical protein